MDMSTVPLSCNRRKSEAVLIYIKNWTAMELHVSVYGHPWLSHIGMVTCKSCLNVQPTQAHRDMLELKMGERSDFAGQAKAYLNKNQNNF